MNDLALLIPAIIGASLAVIVVLLSHVAAYKFQMTSVIEQSVREATAAASKAKDTAAVREAAAALGEAIAKATRDAGKAQRSSKLKTPERRAERTSN